MTTRASQDACPYSEIHALMHANAADCRGLRRTRNGSAGRAGLRKKRATGDHAIEALLCWQPGLNDNCKIPEVPAVSAVLASLVHTMKLRILTSSLLSLTLLASPLSTAQQPATILPRLSVTLL